MLFSLLHISSVFLIGIGGGFHSAAGSKLTEGQRQAILIVMICIGSLLCLWGLFVLLKYSFIKKLIRNRMKWSEGKDAFWNYDKVLALSQECYVKAQLFLNASKQDQLPFLSAHAKARLRGIKKNIRKESDLTFKNAYIVSFIDRKENQNDELTVYFEIINTYTKKKYREIVSFRRKEESLVLTDVSRNPSIYMITHRRSKVEK
ncbi:MAG: hypothetical protein K0S33_852 [Bacteroidetes bacterium]|jgi:hypothetical protein|nr:hypothetical protein [Bacteroidota bacterium]